MSVEDDMDKLDTAKGLMNIATVEGHDKWYLLYELLPVVYVV